MKKSELKALVEQLRAKVSELECFAQRSAQESEEKGWKEGFQLGFDEGWHDAEQLFCEMPMDTHERKMKRGIRHAVWAGERFDLHNFRRPYDFQPVLNPTEEGLAEMLKHSYRISESKVRELHAAGYTAFDMERAFAKGWFYGANRKDNLSEPEIPHAWLKEIFDYAFDSASVF